MRAPIIALLTIAATAAGCMSETKDKWGPLVVEVGNFTPIDTRNFTINISYHNPTEKPLTYIDTGLYAQTISGGAHFTNAPEEFMYRTDGVLAPGQYENFTLHGNFPLGEQVFEGDVISFNFQVEYQNDQTRWAWVQDWCWTTRGEPVPQGTLLCGLKSHHGTWPLESDRAQ